MQKVKAEAIILAGGSGTRIGCDKQFLPLCGRPMLEWSVDVFKSSNLFSRIIVALREENINKHSDWIKTQNITIAHAGKTRIGSLINAAKLLQNDTRIVAVHDGARPLVEFEIIKDCFLKAVECGAAVPVTPVKDTIKKVSSNEKELDKTLDRASLVAAQTPQCYRVELFKEIINFINPDMDLSDESQVLERLGRKVAFVPSNSRNIKITTPEDILIAEAFMNQSSVKSPKTAVKMCRAGFGYDIHRLVEGRPLILGGYRIEHSRGLIGHSDGDAVLHAVCDALLGAVSAGEIGVYFPPTDLTLMGISSVEIAKKTLEVLVSKKAKIINIDVTVVAEEPKLKPYYDNIRSSIASIFKLPISDISVKAKSSEGLGDIGNCGAIACYAIANVLK